MHSVVQAVNSIWLNVNTYHLFLGRWELLALQFCIAWLKRQVSRPNENACIQPYCGHVINTTTWIAAAVQQTLVFLLNVVFREHEQAFPKAIFHGEDAIRPPRIRLVRSRNHL